MHAITYCVVLVLLAVCAQAAVCPDAAVADKANDNYFPKLDLTAGNRNFTHNILTASILGPYVANRTYTNVTFVGAVNEQCWLHTSGSYWNIAADDSVCQDRIALTLPWPQHASCGFVRSNKNVPSTHYQYRAIIVLSFTDEVGIMYEHEKDVAVHAQRTDKAAYEIFVQFLKKVEVTVEEVVIESIVNQRVAVTAVLHDPEHSKVKIEVTVVTEWPNRLIDNDDFNVEIAHPDGLVLVSPTAVSADVSCGNTLYSICVQTLTFEIDVSTACTFNGAYQLNATVVSCRAESETCTYFDAFVKFTLRDADVCGAVTATPVVSGKLVAYKEAAHLTETTDFKIGQTGYFATLFTSENSVSMNYIDIWVQEVIDGVAESKKTYFLRNYALITSYVGEDIEVHNAFGAQGPVMLNINAPTRNNELSIASGVDVYTPHFEFLFHSSVFTVPAYGKKTYNVYATGNVTYLGNERYNGKRDKTLVDFVWKVESASMRADTEVGIVGEAYEEKAAQTPAATQSGVNVLAASLPVAGFALVAIVGAIIIAIIIVKRKNATSFKSLA